MNKLTPKSKDYLRYKEELLEVVSKEPKIIWWKPRTWFLKKQHNSARIYFGDKVFTISQMIDEIKNDTEVGIEHVNMHKELEETRKQFQIKQRKKKLIKLMK